MSSGLFSCFTNCIPSCIMSVFCLPVLWSQVVTRSQIPLLIDFKNYMACTRQTSGYEFVNVKQKPSDVLYNVQISTFYGSLFLDTFLGNRFSFAVHSSAWSCSLSSKCPIFCACCSYVDTFLLYNKSCAICIQNEVSRELVNSFSSIYFLSVN